MCRQYAEHGWCAGRAGESIPSKIRVCISLPSFLCSLWDKTLTTFTAACRDLTHTSVVHRHPTRRTSPCACKVFCIQRASARKQHGRDELDDTRNEPSIYHAASSIQYQPERYKDSDPGEPRRRCICLVFLSVPVPTPSRHLQRRPRRELLSSNYLYYTIHTWCRVVGESMKRLATAETTRASSAKRPLMQHL